MKVRRAGRPTGIFPIVVMAALRARICERPCLSAGLGIHFLLLSVSLQMRAQISPGPLARAHQKLNGPANCTKCHRISPRTREFRCLDCHREIAAELAQHRGLHATWPQGGPAGSACVQCHSEHNGENFALLHWQPTAAGFNHRQTGYVLDGKHAGIGCRICHSDRHIVPPLRGVLAVRDLNHTWMGLSTECVTCHEDRHRGRFGTGCATCHSTGGWQSTHIDTRRFDHSQTAFPLTGKHREPACEKCHTPDRQGQPQWSGRASTACGSCHADPHKGEFKQACDSCHTTSTWQRSRFEASFDHARTDYPLLGRHLTVACTSCHRAADFKAPLPHALCADCHNDAHAGQFSRRADGGRCDSCHTVQGFTPSTYTVADHAATKFPLLPPHDRVACRSCHVPAGPQTRFRLSIALCVDCHKDPHAGQFAGAPWRNHCERCHTGLTFTTNTMTLALHQKTRFALTGGHLAIACSECHKPTAGSTVAVFHFASPDCTTCHEDPHRGQFAARMEQVDASGRRPGCQACHSTEEWHDLSRFDHESTTFALRGAHRAVACSECHRPPAMERTLAHVRFADAPEQCASCHENPHAQQFGSRAGKCDGCHQPEHWRPSAFDHDRTAFSLKGAHQHVPCTACHGNRRTVNGTPVLFYKPTPTACEACHQSATPPLKKNAQQPNTDNQAGRL